MEEALFNWFAQYPYEPLMVYSAIFGVMMVCALGFPMPEEVVILSAGILGHMSLNPDIYPPPYPGAASVDPYSLAFACFVAVIVTDYVIYCLGKFFGKKIINSNRFQKHFSLEKIDKVRNWVHKYGFWAPAVFRFIPGVRFPGHMMCGALDMKPWNFIFTDGLAAMISVPTQVLLVSFLGEAILSRLRQFKLIVFGVLAVVLVAYLLRRYFLNRRKTATAQTD